MKNPDLIRRIGLALLVMFGLIFAPAFVLALNVDILDRIEADPETDMPTLSDPLREFESATGTYGGEFGLPVSPSTDELELIDEDFVRPVAGDSATGFADDLLRLRVNPSGITEIFEGVLGTIVKDLAVTNWNPFAGKEWAWPDHDDVYVIKTGTFECPGLKDDPQDVPYLVGLQNTKITLPMAKSPVSVAAKDGYLDTSIDMGGATLEADVVAYVDGSNCLLVPTLEKVMSVRINGIHGGMDVRTADDASSNHIVIDDVDDISIHIDSVDLDGDFDKLIEYALRPVHESLVGSSCESDTDCWNGILNEVLAGYDVIPKKIQGYLQDALDVSLAFQDTSFYDGSRMTLSASLDHHYIVSDGLYSAWAADVSSGDKSACVGDLTRKQYENHDYHESDAHLNLLLPFTKLTELVERALNQGETCGTETVSASVGSKTVPLQFDFYPQGELQVMDRYDALSGGTDRLYVKIPFEADVASSSASVSSLDENIPVKAVYVVAFDLKLTCENDFEMTFADGTFDSLQGRIQVAMKSGRTAEVELRDHEARIKSAVHRKLIASPLAKLKLSPGLTELEAFGYHLELAKVAVDQSRVQAGLIIQQGALKECDWDNDEEWKKQTLR